MQITCASEVTGTASPASANENKITEEARRIPILSRLSIVIASLRAKYREIKAHLMIAGDFMSGDPGQMVKFRLQATGVGGCFSYKQ